MVYLKNNREIQTLYVPMDGVSGERRYGNYATKEYVDDAIANETARTEATYIKKNELPEDIATKEYVDEEIARVESEIPSLDGYATEEYVDEHLSEYNPTDNFKTINEQSIIGVGDIHIDGAIYTAGEHISISDDNVISTTGLPSTEDVTSAITEAVSGKADTTYVDQKVEDTLESAQTYADGLMEAETARTESTYLKEHQSLEGYATEEWVEEQGYLTEHQDISGKADITYVDSEISRVEGLIPSVEGLASEEYVDAAVEAEKQRSEATYLKEHQDISGKADITYVDDEIERIEGEIPTKVSDLSNDLGFIDNTVNNLVNYYTSAQTYTQAEINALVEAIPHFSILVVNELPATGDSATVYLVRNEESTGTDLYDEWIYVNNTWEHLGTARVDMSQYYTKTETDALLAEKADVEDVPSLDGYATEEYVDDAVSGKADTSAVTQAISSAIAAETARTESTYLKEHQSLEGYATEEWVEEQGYLTEHQDISGLATKTELSTAIASETARTESTYLKEHQDISGKADITYVDEEISRVEGLIPSVEGLASEEYVDNAIASETARTESTYLKEHQNIKTINEQSLVGTGNIQITEGMEIINYDDIDDEMRENICANPDKYIIKYGENSELFYPIYCTSPQTRNVLVAFQNLRVGEVTDGGSFYQSIISITLNYKQVITNQEAFYNKEKIDGLITEGKAKYITDDNNKILPDLTFIYGDIDQAGAYYRYKIYEDGNYLGEYYDLIYDNSVKYWHSNWVFSKFYWDGSKFVGSGLSFTGELTATTLTCIEYSSVVLVADETYGKIIASTDTLALQSGLDGKQDTLTAGEGISIDSANTISVTGGTGGLTPEEAQEMIDSAITSETARTEATYLKEHQSIKTINEHSLIGTGDIQITEGMEVIKYNDIDNEIALKIVANPSKYIVVNADYSYYPYKIGIGFVQFASSPTYEGYAGTDTYRVYASGFTVTNNTVTPPSIGNIWSYSDYTKEAIDSLLTQGAPYIRDNNNTIYPDLTYQNGWTSLTGAYNKYDLISGGRNIGSLEFNSKQGVWTGPYFSPMSWTGTLFQGKGMEFYGELTATTLSSADPNMYLVADENYGQISGSTDYLVLQSDLDEKQDTLTAGTGIDITDNVISVTGGTGGSTVEVEQVLTAGTKIATITVDDEPTDIYAPQGGGSGGGETVIELTQAEYDAIVPPYPENTTYIITDSPAVDMDDYQKVEDMDNYYTKTEVDTELEAKATAQNISAKTSGYQFPNWNAQGLVTGNYSTWYSASFNVNGSGRNVLSSSSSSLPTIYAPTAAGTKDQVLLSNGSGAPVWSNSNVITAGLTMVCLTQEQYDAIVTKDPNTMYIIKEE